jgi:hypothetical protein
MAGAETVIKLIFLIITVVAVIAIGLVGVAVVGPIFSAVPSAPASLGWGSLKGTFFEFFTLGIIGLIMVAFVWWWFSPIQSDVRQNERQRF